MQCDARSVGRASEREHGESTRARARRGVGSVWRRSHPDGGLVEVGGSELGGGGEARLVGRAHDVVGADASEELLAPRQAAAEVALVTRGGAQQGAEPVLGRCNESHLECAPVHGRELAAHRVRLQQRHRPLEHGEERRIAPAAIIASGGSPGGGGGGGGGGRMDNRPASHPPRDAM